MNTAATDFDVVVIGAGIAGASLSAELTATVDSPHRRILIVEAEAVPGYHTTGRSAAFWSETYGGPGVLPLTIASRDWLARNGWLTPRGHLWIALPGDEHRLEALHHQFDDRVFLLPQDRSGMAALVPGLVPSITHGLWEPDCCDIDVAGFHADCLSRVLRAGGTIWTDFRVERICKSGDRWSLSAQDGRAVTSAVIVNAAGAWADAVAAMAGVAPLGLIPMRRTVAQVTTRPTNPAHLPLVIDVAGGVYFKTQGEGRLWICPQDETPMNPHDVAPEEIDVATAIARVEDMSEWRIGRVERKWAGLRTFAPDRLPVYGFDTQVDGFFWCAGQGGFGIQTAPAAARMAAALLMARDNPLPQVDAARYRPDRPSLGAISGRIGSSGDSENAKTRKLIPSCDQFDPAHPS